MNRFTRAACVAPLLISAMALQGCTTSIKATSSHNPPPAEAFSAFGRIEVRPAVYKDGYVGNPAALAKINQNIQLNLSTQLMEWNKAPSNDRVLVIEPVVEEMRFKSSVKRVFLGPLAGSSGVLMRLNIRDKAGRQVSSPEFFQRADAMAAGWTLGVHDNMMLTRVASLSTTYVVANYARAVGGPTGGADPVLSPK